MPERTIKRRLQDCDAALASDDGPIFSTVAKLVHALKRSIPEGTQNAELIKEALRLGRDLLRGTKYEQELKPTARDSVERRMRRVINPRLSDRGQSCRQFARLYYFGRIALL
jgi:hypothetical protein